MARQVVLNLGVDTGHTMNDFPIDIYTGTTTGGTMSLIQSGYTGSTLDLSFIDTTLSVEVGRHPYFALKMVCDGCYDILTEVEVPRVDCEICAEFVEYIPPSPTPAVTPTNTPAASPASTSVPSSPTPTATVTITPTPTLSPGAIAPTPNVTPTPTTTLPATPDVTPTPTVTTSPQVAPSLITINSAQFTSVGTPPTGYPSLGTVSISDGQSIEEYEWWYDGSSTPVVYDWAAAGPSTSSNIIVSPVGTQISSFTYNGGVLTPSGGNTLYNVNITTIIGSVTYDVIAEWVTYGCSVVYLCPR